MTIDVVAGARRLLQQRGLAREIVGHEECRVGGNNRVVRIDTDGGAFVAKLYFDDGRRDRLQSEYSFLEYAKGIGLRCVPSPVARDPQLRLGLYEYVKGRPFTASTLTREHVDRAVEFFQALNAPPRKAATALGAASDAGFSVADHLQGVERRLARLLQMPIRDEVDAEGRAFVVDLETSWKTLRKRLQEALSRVRVPLDRALPPEQRCVSPSDFGFHNALLAEEGGVVFLDFEYAGWDDPAKAIGDFFGQPRVPVDRRWFHEVAAAFTSHAPEAAVLAQRARLLFPLFWFQWCLIRMNEFTPEVLERRMFADRRIDVAGRKRAQLESARHALAALPEVPS